MRPPTLHPALLAGLLCASLTSAQDAAPTTEADGLGRTECLEWVDRTYDVEALAKKLDPELGADYSKLRDCVARDVQLMAVPIPVPWCDNVFKIHCSGLDLLTEIGEALILRCENHLAESLGAESVEEADWKRCGRNQVFDDYSLRGQASDQDACEAAYRKGCEREADA